MSSIDAGVNASAVKASVSRALPARRRLRLGSILGGFLLTGTFLAFSAAAFPVAAVYSFIWWAQH